MNLFHYREIFTADFFNFTMNYIFECVPYHLIQKCNLYNIVSEHFFVIYNNICK